MVPSVWVVIPYAVLPDFSEDGAVMTAPAACLRIGAGVT